MNRFSWRYLVSGVALISALSAGIFTTQSSSAALVPPFTKISQPGFDNDPQNGYTQGMAWFNGKLYAGTTRDEACVEGATAQFYFPQFKIYTTTPSAQVTCTPDEYDLDLRAEIWQYDPQTTNWTRVFQSTTANVVTPNGEFKPIAKDIGFRNMAVLTTPNGQQNLFVAGTSAKEYIPNVAGPRILRSSDGTNFTPVNLIMPALLQTKSGNSPAIGFRAMAVFNGRLFVSAVQDLAGDGVLMEAKPLAPDGSTLQLTQVTPPDLDVYELEPFNNQLYVGAADGTYGYSVWRTSASGSAPYLFTPVVTNGAGRGASMLSVVSMHVFRGWLYVGASGFFPSVTPTSELIRIAPDDSWQLVVGNPRLAPQGFVNPISGLQDGFGNPFNAHIWRMSDQNGILYAGTNDDSLSQLGQANVPQSVQDQFGFDVFGTLDGTNWFEVTHNGFNNPFDFGARTMVSAPPGLFIGSVDYIKGTSIYEGGGAQGTVPGNVTVENQNGQNLVSWDAAAGATQYAVFRASFLPNSQVGVTRPPNVPQLPAGDSLMKLGFISGNYQFAPTTLIPQPFTQIGTTSNTYLLDSSASGASQFAYYVLAQNGQGQLSNNSNTAIFPNLNPTATLDALQSAITSMQNNGRITSALASTLQQSLTTASAAAASGDLTTALSSVQSVENAISQNQGGAINVLYQPGLQLLADQLLRRVSMAQSGVLPASSLFANAPAATVTPTVTPTATATVSGTPSTTTPTATVTATPTGTSQTAATSTPTRQASATATVTPTATATSGNNSGPVAPPSGLTASTTASRQINLRWTASSTSGVSYRVYRGTAPGNEALYKSGVSGTSFSDQGAQPFSIYWYKVTAVSSSGVESAPTAEVWGQALS